MDSCVWIPGFGFLRLDSLVWISGFGFLGLDSLVWIPRFGFLGLDSWVWIPGFGFLGLESSAWIPGLGFLGLEPWVWSPGLGFLDLDSWPEPIARIDFSYVQWPQIANPEQVLTFEFRWTGELGPETHFFLQALHKLARALQLTLPWWGGLEEIGRDSFNITYAAI